MNKNFWHEADMDSRFFVGDQSVWSEVYGNLPSFRQKQFSFNRIRPVVNMISGHQRRNRKSIIATPVENGDEETASQFSKIMMWSAQQDNILETISDAFEGALVTGLNLLQVWVDFRNDPISGHIRVDNCSYNSFVIDPYFKKSDLSDCNAIWKRTFVTRKEAMSLIPDKSDEIEEMPMAGNDKDGKFQYMPESFDYTNHNLLTYDEYYYRSYRKQKILVDTQTGETLEWTHDNPESLERFLSVYPQVTEIMQTIPTVRLAILVQGKVMYDGPNPIGTDCYPFVPVFGYFNPQVPYFEYRIQGVVRGLRDPQFLYNRRKVTEFDILESQVNSGYIYKENALVNPSDIFLTGQGKGIALKEEAQITDVQKIPAAEIPQSMIQLSEIISKEIQMISGVNEELMGSAVDEKAGVLSMLRQGAGLTTLQSLFDSLDRSQKNLGKLFIDVIQSNFTPGKVKKIIEEEPMPQFYSKAFGKYDAAIEDGLNTTTQRQMQFAQLLQLREAGVQVPDTALLEASTIQDKKKLLESVSAVNQQQQQQAQAQAESEQRNQMAVIKSLEAKAQSDQSLGIERLSKVQDNAEMAEERKASAQKDRMSGILDLVKALKEIDQIDLNQLDQLVQLSRALKDEESSANKVESPSVPQMAQPMQ
jgi:hypothetical protein